MSGAAFDFTEEQRANYRLDCAEKAAAAARRAALREARQARGGAMSNAERQRAFVARANDLREIPAPADPEGREACRRDFLRFVHRYGAALLKDHAPAPLMCEKFLRPLQQSVLDGGQILVEMPRGKGKTTFIDLCAAWAVAYGHRRFVVLISATGKLAKVNLKNIMRVFLSPAFAADFPEISAPFLALDGKWQLCETQTFRGEKTGIELKTDRIVFPTVRGDDGAPLGDAGGAILFSGGVGGAIRGLNEGGVRPDMVFFDDIQKRKDAKSPALSAGLEEFVNQDAMGLFGHGAPKTALMAITPICDGDFAALMTDRERNPAWISVVIPLVLEWPADRDLVDRFFALYKDDCARDDFARTQSRAFFAANRDALWKGCVLLDPMDGGADEIDALHHVLVLVAALGLLNRRYRRDIETESGRRAWHGREVGQTLLTNDAGRLVMRRTYADGFTFDDAARRQTARVAASNMAARVRASLPTNGVSPRVASLRAQSAANAGTTVTNVTVTVGGVRRMPRYARAFDNYGNVTNKTLVGWQETFQDADGVLTIRILDADGNLVRERKQRHPSKSRAAGNATKED